jgi:hypothetical protein
MRNESYKRQDALDAKLGGRTGLRFSGINIVYTRGLAARLVIRPEIPTYQSENYETTKIEN